MPSTDWLEYCPYSSVPAVCWYLHQDLVSERATGTIDAAVVQYGQKQHGKRVGTQQQVVGV